MNFWYEPGYEPGLLALDSGGSDGTVVDFKTCYDKVFRSFHNLKGASGMMEMGDLQTHTHELENILMGLKDNSDLPKEFISFFLKGIDGARTLLDGQSIQFSYAVGGDNESSTSSETTNTELAAAEPVYTASMTSEFEGNDSAINANSTNSTNSTTSTNSALEEFFAECDEIIARISEDLKKIESGDNSKELLNNLYRDMHSLKGASYLFGFAGIGDIAHAMAR